MKPQSLDDYIQRVLDSEYSSDHRDFEDDMKINITPSAVTQKSLSTPDDTVYSSHE